MSIMPPSDSRDDTPSDDTQATDQTSSVATSDPDFMTSLARGLSVLSCFAEHRKPMSISQLSQRTGISRAAVRRCLHTLVKLGYAAQEGQQFGLLPKVLSLGYAYLSSSSLAVTAQPLLDQIRDGLRESCSLGVMEADEVCYVARSESSRIMSIALRVGSRLPLYCTSMGRVLLAWQEDDAQRAYLARTDLLPRTSRTVTDPSALLQRLAEVRAQGYAVTDEELEIGLRSIAVPVFGRSGQLVAAVNIGTQSARVSVHEMESRYLPQLQRIARELSLHAA